MSRHGGMARLSNRPAITLRLLCLLYVRGLLPSALQLLCTYATTYRPPPYSRFAASSTRRIRQAPADSARGPCPAFKDTRADRAHDGQGRVHPRTQRAAVWKLAELLRLVDYLTSAAELKLTVLCLGVSEHAVEGTHTRSDASRILSLNCTLQIAVGTLAQVRRGDTAVKTRSGRRTSTDGRTCGVPART